MKTQIHARDAEHRYWRNAFWGLQGQRRIPEVEEKEKCP